MSGSMNGRRLLHGAGDCAPRVPRRRHVFWRSWIATAFLFSWGTVTRAEDGFDPADVVFPDDVRRAGACAGVAASDRAAGVRCLIEAEFSTDRRALSLAMGLLGAGGHVVGVERPYDMDGGFRGLIHIVPERPVGAYRRHLAWLAVRYFNEQHAYLSGRPPRGGRFKCGPRENLEAWNALVEEFFGGVDLGPRDCP
jgi:hypothetical protein